MNQQIHSSVPDYILRDLQRVIHEMTSGRLIYLRTHKTVGTQTDPIDVTLTDISMQDVQHTQIDPVGKSQY